MIIPRISPRKENACPDRQHDDLGLHSKLKKNHSEDMFIQAELLELCKENGIQVRIQHIADEQTSSLPGMK